MHNIKIEVSHLAYECPKFRRMRNQQSVHKPRDRDSA